MMASSDIDTISNCSDMAFNNDIPLYEILFKSKCFDDIDFYDKLYSVESNEELLEKYSKSNDMAHELRLMGNEQFGLKEYNKALVYYTLAISASVPNEPNDLDSESDSEIAILYSNRSLTFNAMQHIDNAIKDSDRAIKYSNNQAQRKKFYLRKINILCQTRSPYFLKQATSELEQLLSNFELSETEKKVTATFSELVKNKTDLRRLNTINIDSISESKLVKSLRLPLQVQKDQTLLLNWIEHKSPFVVLKHEKLSVEKSKRSVVKVCAKKQIDKLELLSMEKALVLMANNQHSCDYCAYCLNSLSLVASVPCRGCNQLLFYCDEQCETNAWNEYHLYECAPSIVSWCQLSFIEKFLLRIVQKVSGLNQFVTLLQNALTECQCEQQFVFDDDWFENHDNGFWFQIFCNWIMQSKAQTKFVKKINLQILIQHAVKIYDLIKPDLEVHHQNDSIKSLAQFLALMDNLLPNIVQPIQMVPTYPKDELFDHTFMLSKLAEYSEQNSNECWWTELDKVLEEQFTENIRTPKTIGFGLYPAHSMLWKQSSCKGNALMVYSGAVQGVRALNPLTPSHSIYVKRNLLSAKNTDPLVDCRDMSVLTEGDIELMACHHKKETEYKSIELIEQQKDLINMMLESDMIDTYNYVHLALNDLLLQNNNAKSAYTESVSVCESCLHLASKCIENSRLYVHYLIQQVKAEFQWFTERNVSIQDSVSIATRCLIHCSHVMSYLHQNTLPLKSIEMVSMLKQKEIRLENVSPNWINTDNLDLLAELEDMMVSSDMFIQQFESYKAKDFKPE